MNNASTPVFLLSFALLALAPASAFSFSADASVTGTACGGFLSGSDGGNDFALAVVSDSASGVCGPTAEDDAVAAASGYADIANGVVYASGLADGVAGANRANGRGEFTDFLFLNAPAEVDTVQVRVSLDFVAENTGQFSFSNDLLAGRVQIDTVGVVEIRRCTPIICPGFPIESDSVSQEFTINRSMFSGEFPQISVSMNTTIDTVNGAGAFLGTVSIEVIDASGATFSSDSGVFGTGSGYDTDSDGVPDALDNCRLHFNPDQRDTDSDGFGNRCDPDFDNNLVVNFSDLATLSALFFSTDEDADLNGDGIVNFGDLMIMSEFFFGPPGPGAD